MIFTAIIKALDNLQEALAASTMLRHRRSYERRLRRVVVKMFGAQGKAVADLWNDSNIHRPVGGALGLASVEFVEDFAAILAEAYQRAFDSAERDLKEDLGPDLMALMRQRAAQRITGVDATTRDLIATLVAEAVKDNWSYTKLAVALRKLFKDFITPVRQRHIRDRAELIAVTEVGQAYIDGQMDLGRRREAAGVAIEKSWLTVGDDRVSDGCRENQAQGWVPFGTPFRSGHASPLRFPGCRCALQMRKGDAA